MTAPMNEDGGLLREWSPLVNLLQKLPTKIQNGLFSHNINFTCIDVIPEFIAIGTNHGLIFWFNRDNGELQKLRCENTYATITCVRLVSTVDFMLAAGNNQGIVTVFQIPKEPPESLPDNLKSLRKKQVERYNIAGLHKSPVTTVDWSKNGMKLFSGDQDGLVVSTEIDFYMHLSKSSELLNEKYPVVQLSYQKGLLLVSTLLRTILVSITERGKVLQVGQKERKTLCKLGAIFANKQSQVQEPLIYAGRPGLRLWQANKNGTVLRTLMFRDALRASNTRVELLNPAPEITKKNRGEPSFGIVLSFSDDILVTYNESIIYVLNPNTITIMFAITDLRYITDVACTKDEIFVLEGERNIIRIAYHPEDDVFAPSVNPVIDSIFMAESNKSVKAGLMQLTSKLKESVIFSFPRINPTNLIQSIGILSSVTTGTDLGSVSSAEEVFEVPPIIPLKLETPLEISVEPDLGVEVEVGGVESQYVEENYNDRRLIFQKIAEQEFEDVVFSPERRRKKSANRIINRNEILENGSSDIISSLNLVSGETKTYSSLLMLSVDNNMLLKLKRDLDSIQKDVEDKEKLLAEILNFDLSERMSRNRINPPNSSNENLIDKIKCADCSDQNASHDQQIEDNDQGNHTNGTESESVEEDASYKTELKILEELEECRKDILQGKFNTQDERDCVDIGVEPSTCNVMFNPKIKVNDSSSEFVPAVVYENCKEEGQGDWILVDYPR